MILSHVRVAAVLYPNIARDANVISFLFIQSNNNKCIQNCLIFASEKKRERKRERIQENKIKKIKKKLRTAVHKQTTWFFRMCSNKTGGRREFQNSFIITAKWSQDIAKECAPNLLRSMVWNIYLTPYYMIPYRSLLQ